MSGCGVNTSACWGIGAVGLLWVVPQLTGDDDERYDILGRYISVKLRIYRQYREIYERADIEDLTTYSSPCARASADSRLSLYAYSCVTLYI